MNELAVEKRRLINVKRDTILACDSPKRDNALTYLLVIRSKV